MFARFFRPRAILIGFLEGFAGGIISGQGHAVLTEDQRNRNPRIINAAPGIAMVLGMALGVMIHGHQLREPPDYPIAFFV